MIHYVINKLKATTAVTDLVPSAKIYPLLRTQGTEIPCIVIQLNSMEPNHQKDKSSTIDRYIVHVTSFASSPKVAWDIAQAVRNTLDGWSEDTNVKESRIVNQASDVFESTDVFHFAQEYEILVQ
jgi:hypothetical protein